MKNNNYIKKFDKNLFFNLDHLRKKGIPTESLKPYNTYGIIDEDDAQERSQTEARMWTAIDSLPEKCRPIQNKLSGHNLAKALKVCIDDYMQ